MTESNSSELPSITDGDKKEAKKEGEKEGDKLIREFLTNCPHILEIYEHHKQCVKIIEDKFLEKLNQ